MIGSSGDAETNAVKSAAAAWSKQSGNTTEVIVASDLGQQLGQGFAGGTPPDLFYADAARIGDFAKVGNLYAYGDQVKRSNFLPSLVKTFTYKNTLQCAPKDYSTLALAINTDMWTAAGLTDADIPTDWAGLEKVAKKLTKGKVTGLVIGNDINRGDVFMKQAGDLALGQLLGDLLQTCPVRGDVGIGQAGRGPHVGVDRQSQCRVVLGRALERVLVRERL